MKPPAFISGLFRKKNCHKCQVTEDVRTCEDCGLFEAECLCAQEPVEAPTLDAF